jgi:hypothetical protein
MSPTLNILCLPENNAIPNAALARSAMRSQADGKIHR